MQINRKLANTILSIHAEWLKDNGYKKEYKDCLKQSELKRTSVHIMPSAIPCTATEEAVEYRGGVEPLLLQEYVHGNCRG